MVSLLRPAFRASVAVLSAFVIAFTSAVPPRSDPSTPRAALHAAVELRLVSHPLLDPRVASAISSLSPAQLLGAARAIGTADVAPAIAPYPPLVRLADLIDAAYLAIEPWVRYGVKVASHVAAIIIPYVGWVVIKQTEVFYNFFESLIHSAVFNTTDWLRGQGGITKNVTDWLLDAGLALVWLGYDEIDSWIPLPPLPLPRPPFFDVQGGLFGHLAAGASAALAAASHLSHGIWNLRTPIKGGGLLAAKSTSAHGTSESIGTPGSVAIAALVDWGCAQLDYFTGRLAPGAVGAPTVRRASVVSTDRPAGPAADRASADTDNRRPPTAIRAEVRHPPRRVIPQNPDRPAHKPTPTPR